MAGLQDYSYDNTQITDKILQRVMAPMTVYQAALDSNARDRINKLKDKYNEETLSDLTQRNPLERAKLQQELDTNDYKTSPEYKEYMTRIQKGQADTQEASGNVKRETNPQDIRVAKQKLYEEEIMNRVRNVLAEQKHQAVFGQGDETGGTIGFPMQGQPEAQPTSGFNWQVPPEVQRSRDMASLGIMRQEQAQNPNDVALQRDIANRTQTIAANGGPASPPQAINANNSPMVQQPPLRNGGITPGGPQYERAMQALVDTPEQRAKLQQMDQKLDSNEFLRMATLQQAEQLATQRRQASGGGKDPFSEWNKLSPHKRLGLTVSALEAGINPITREPLKPGEDKYWDAQAEQDAKVIASQKAATEGQLDVSGLTKGEVPTKEQPRVRIDSPSKKPVSDADLINKYSK